MQLTPRQKAILTGTLLGDGNLSTGSNGKTWRYRVLHSEAQKDYLFEKYNAFSNLCNTEPSYAEIEDPRTQKKYKRWYFNTKVDSQFLYYAKLFYTQNPTTGQWIKDVPQNIEALLSPEAVAFWYMDDGALKWYGNSNAMRICTESFSEAGVRRLSKALSNLYGIETQVVPKTKGKPENGFRLAINEKNSGKFRQLIQPYLVSSMLYKVSDGKRGSLAD